jgi:hypothetical protein
MKSKKLRFLAVFILALTFGVRFAVVGVSSFLFSGSLFSVSPAHALTFTKDNLKDFRYNTDTLKYLAKIDLGTFVGRPVKIPFAGANPDKVPGGDQNWVIVHPPRFLNAKATVPMQIGLFASGKSVSPEDAQLVKEVEDQINTIANNNPVMLEILKNMLERNLRISVKDEASLVALLLQVARAQDGTDDAVIADNPLLLTDADLSSLGLSDLDTSNPQVKQLLVIMLLLLLINQALAQSVNTDKQDCLESGGEWINNECVSENIQLCEENGGMWKKFKNQCLADKQFCGNEALKCKATGTADEAFFGCACKAGNCLNEEGLCVERDEGNKAVCEESAGSWQNFSSPKTLCLGRCSATETMCQEGSSSQQWTMSVSQLDKSSKNCKCPEGKCLAADGSCIADEKKSGDDDKDGVTNQYDRCPGTPQGEPVNTVQGSPDQGCSCNQLAAMGRIPKPYCPPDGCEGDYLVRYDRGMLQNPQQLCQNGVIQQQQQFQTVSGTGGVTTSACPVISREPNQQCAEQNNKNKNDNLNKKLDDLLKQLKDQNKKPNQGKQPNQGGGGGGNGGGGGGPDPGSKDDKDKEKEKEKEKEKAKAQLDGASPEGVGEINAERNGTSEQPYILHVSQFTKLCGKNVYVLTNGKPSKGNFINKSGEKATSGPDVNKLMRGTCGPTDPNCGKVKGEVINAIQKSGIDWTKVNKSTVDAINTKIDELVKLSPGTTNQTGPIQQGKMNEIKNAIDNLISQAKQEANTTTSIPKKEGAESMDKVKDAGGPTYFKVPSCQKLAECHCCVCSCCDCQKKECGFSIQKKCNEGECAGEKCTKCPDAMQTCKDEKPEKSIAITMGPLAEIEKCTKGEKKVTSMRKCENFKDPVHQSVCRYDCSGEETGCSKDKKYEDCEIVVMGIEGNDIVVKEKNDTRWLPNIVGNSAVKFTNDTGGSVIGTSPTGAKPPSETGWIKNLEKKEGKCCKCDDKKQEPGDSGLNKSQSQSGQQSGASSGGQPPATPPGQKPSILPTSGRQQKIPTEMSNERIGELTRNNPDFQKYLNNKDREKKITEEDWNKFQEYLKWYNGWSPNRLWWGYINSSGQPSFSRNDYFVSFGFWKEQVNRK